MVTVYQYSANAAANTTTVTVTMQKPSAPGDLLLIAISGLSGGIYTQSVADNLGNTYQRAVAQTTYTDEEIWYGVVNTNQTYTFTVRTTAPTTFQVTVIELSGVDTTNPFACVNGQSGTATASANTATVNPACNPKNLFLLTMIGGYNSGGTATIPGWSVGNGLLTLLEYTFSGTGFEGAIAYIQPTFDLTSITWTELNNVNVNWDAVTLVINPTPTYQAPSGLCASLLFPLNEICSAFTAFAGYITSVGQGIWGGLLFVAQGIIHFADQIYGALVAFGQWLYNAFSTIGSYIAKGLTDAFNALGSALQYIQTGLAQVGSYIRCGLIDIVNLVITGINWLVDTIEGGLQYIANAVLGGVATLITSIESVIITIQNAVVTRIKNALFVTLTMPAELKIARSLFEGFTSGGDMKVGRKLIGLVITPIIAKAITDFVASFAPLQPISQLWFRPQFPTVTLPLVKIPLLPTCGTPTTTPVSITTPTPYPTISDVLANNTSIATNLGLTSTVIVTGGGATTTSTGLGTTSSISTGLTSSVSTSVT